jgi:hypothetical protein
MVFEATIFSDIITMVIVVLLVLIWTLPDKAVYITYGSLLLILGIFPLLNYFRVVNFDIYSYPAVYYIVLYVVITAGEILVYESLHEHAGLKALSKFIGVFIVIVTAIPTLEEFGGLSFKMPSYSPTIDCVFYLTASVLLIIGAITYSKS